MRCPWRIRRRHGGDGGTASPPGPAQRRGVAVLAGTAAIALTLLVTPQAAGADEGTFVATDVLNLRSGPGTWAEVVTQMWQGDPIEILSGPTEDGWYEVRYQGLQGWAYGGYLAIHGAPGWDSWEEATAVGGVVAAASTAWVDTDRLNIRSWPGSDAEVLDQVSYGDAVTVTGAEVDGYVPISHWGGEAWVWAGFLRFDGPPGPEHWVDVDRSSQIVTLYEGDVPVASYWGAMGFDQSDDGFFATANGTFYVYAKNADLTWTDWGRAFVRDWVAFDPYRANGFHSYSLDRKGRPIEGGDGPTGGCVALPPWAADHLFDFVRIGSRVEVHW